jgi:hypothetical protein
MADIASARAKLNTDEVAQDKPITEALHSKIGADINYLIDERDTLDSRADELEDRVSDLITNNNALDVGLKRVATYSVSLGADTDGAWNIWVWKELDTDITYVRASRMNNTATPATGTVTPSTLFNTGVDPDIWDVATYYGTRTGLTYTLQVQFFAYITTPNVSAL